MSNDADSMNFSGKQTRNRAFTLIELLVVIGIIAILAALLLPVLSQSKIRAQTIACLNDVTQLQLCFHLYTGDNNDFLPPNNFVYDAGTGQPFAGDVGPSWCTNLAPFDARPDGIRNGLLYQYNNSVPIYHCPADQSTLEIPGGNPLPQLRLRSYNMSQSINGLNYAGDAAQYFPHYRKLTTIRNPAPEALLVFLDENENTILDTQFGIPVAGSNEYGTWWDMPANRHGQGCNLSFADGHVEHWKWKVPKVVNVVTWPPQNSQRVGNDEWDDYHRMESGFLQTLD
jgi:prepilin-type N-terminal cleavage/methylation domain-containing protein/prepilin-type processing-associated H-X9-DG protein